MFFLTIYIVDKCWLVDLKQQTMRIQDENFADVTDECRLIEDRFGNYTNQYNIWIITIHEGGYDSNQPVCLGSAQVFEHC